MNKTQKISIYYLLSCKNGVMIKIPPSKLSILHFRLNEIIEGPNDALCSLKKRKLAFSSNSCCFCKKNFKDNRTTLNPNTFDSILTVCKGRNDELSVNITSYENEIRNNEVSVYYHKACRSKFMHPFYSDTDSIPVKKPENVTIETKFTRSQKVDTFD